ncbi:MAG: LysR family transcriptional regulator [Pseudomonadota bacterium]
MPRAARKKELSLRWLELFQICAQKGSLQAAAKETGLSMSTVSHHLRSLEEHLGIALFNHARRPMVLTPKGRVFLRNIDSALFTIRKAKAEASAGSVAEASLLRIGTIEDFDSDVMPAMAVFLAQSMPGCDFLYQTDLSHEIIRMLRDRHLDLGISSAPSDHQRDLQDRPLLRDPFVAVLPRMTEQPISDVMAGLGDLPFLRFSSDLIIAQRIEAHLRRLGVASRARFECSNNQTLLAMVAAGAGWTITTPLLFSRSNRRFQEKVVMRQIPGRPFSRTLSIIATPDCSRSVLELFDTKIRSFVEKYAIAEQTRQNPWLAESYQLIS